MRMILQGMAVSFGMAGAMLAVSAWAGPDTATDAARFGARDGVIQMSLAPDGKHVAMIQPTKGAGAALLIADTVAGGSPRVILQSSGSPDRLRWCKWSSDTRLICNLSIISKGSERLGFSRMITIGSDGKGIRMLTADTNSRSLGIALNGGEVIDWLADGADGQVLMTRVFIPETETNTSIKNERRGLGVEQVNPAGTNRRIVLKPRLEAVDYVTDGHGVVRLMGEARTTNIGYATGRYDYSYRLAGSDVWKPFGTLQFDGEQQSGFNPIAVDRDLNVAYGFEKQDGRLAVSSVALDGTLTRKPVLARADVDVDGLIRLGRQNRVVGATFVTDKRESEFFDPELRKLRAALGKALPGQPLVTFVDASADEKTLLLYAGSDTDPGRYYLYAKPTRKLEEVTVVRPELDGVALAPVKPVTFPAADRTMIPGYLTLPPGSTGKGLPAIVMPHGGPGARDEWGFDWLAQFYAARGYAVLQPNYRGSTGYGDAWFQKNGFQSWRIAIGDVNDAGRWLNKQGIAAPGKLAIVGWSYGGYAALQSSALDADLFKAVVAIAPVTDLDMWRGESMGFSNYKIMDAFIGRGPHVAEGSPARNAQKIKAPVLMFHGDLDLNVGVAESRVMADRLRDAGKKVEYVEFKGLDHQLDDDGVRKTMLAKSDAFLRGTLGL